MQWYWQVYSSYYGTYSLVEFAKPLNSQMLKTSAAVDAHNALSETLGNFIIKCTDAEEAEWVFETQFGSLAWRQHKTNQ